eukprot:TRINITY_DN8276_c0_g2_i1.p1 TRINITY_DN8276_c0_g2~~TRINITY_DN8276_c0_g2_i1.p1  ORF type:complete len:1090 (+),score=237.86 TRINITY_DN8276_c0_g2_i1:28-3297(+)
MPPDHPPRGVTPQYLLKGVLAPINSNPVGHGNGTGGFSPLGREVLDFEEEGRVLDIACDEKHGTIYCCGKRNIYQWDRRTGRLGKKPTENKHVQLDYSNARLIALALPGKNSGGQVLGYSLSNRQRFLKTLGCIIPSSANVTTSIAQQDDRIFAAEWHQHQSPRVACYSFDSSECREVGSYSGHKAAISVVKTHDQTLFTSADRIGKIVTWDFRQSTPAVTLQKGDGVPVLSTSACGNLLGCSNAKGEIKIFDIRKGNSLHQRLDKQQVGIGNSMAVTESGLVFVASYEGIFELSDWLQGRSATVVSEKSANSLRYSSESRAIVVGHSQSVQLYYPFLEKQNLVSSGLSSPSSSLQSPERSSALTYSTTTTTSTPYFSSWSSLQQEQPLQPVNIPSDESDSDDGALSSPPLVVSPPTPPSYLINDPTDGVGSLLLPKNPPTPPANPFPSLPKSNFSGILQEADPTVTHRLNYPSYSTTGVGVDTDIQSILSCINTDDFIKVECTNTIDTIFVIGLGEGHQRLVGKYLSTGPNEWNCCENKMRIRRKGAIWFIADDATGSKLAEARSPSDHPTSSFEWYTRMTEGIDDMILVTTSIVVFELFLLLPPSESLRTFRSLSHSLEQPNKSYAIDVSYSTLDSTSAGNLMTFLTRYKLQPSRLVFGQRAEDPDTVSDVISKGLPTKCTSVDVGHSQSLAMSCAAELHKRGGGVLVIRIRDDDAAYKFSKQIRKISEQGFELEVKTICSSRVTWKGKAELEIDIDVPFSSMQAGVVVNIEDDLETQSSTFTIQLPEKNTFYTAEAYHSCAAALIDLAELSLCHSDEKEAILQFVVAGASLKKIRISFAQHDGTADDLLVSVFKNPLLTSLEVAGDVDAFFDHLKRQSKSVVRRSSIKCLYLKGGSLLTPEVLEDIISLPNLLGIRQNVATSSAAPVLQQLLAFLRRGTRELALLILGSIVSRKPWKPATTLDTHMSAACAWKGLSDDCEFDSVSMIPTFDELPQQRPQHPPSRVCSNLSSCQSTALDISESDVFDLLQSSGVPLTVCEMLKEEGIDGSAFRYLTDVILRDELMVADAEVRNSILRARNNVLTSLR